MEYSHTVDFGFKLLEYINMDISKNERKYFKENWGEMYNNNEQNPLDTLISCFTDCFVMQAQGKRINTTELKNRSLIFQKKMERFEITEKYESNQLFEILESFQK